MNFLKFLAFFAFAWLFVNYLLGYLSGWISLAREYRVSEPFSGRQWKFKSGFIGPALGLGSLRNCLNIGVNSAGLYVSLLFPFRPGKPPFFVPWNEITVKNEQVLFLKFVVFRFARVPSVTLRVYEHLGKEIIAERDKRSGSAA
jgi:hypothetical protein